MLKSNVLRIITIYNSPDDFPGEFVAREFHILKEGIKTGDVIYRSDDLESIRNNLRLLNLVPCQRDINDLPSVVESWI